MVKGQESRNETEEWVRRAVKTRKGMEKYLNTTRRLLLMIDVGCCHRVNTSLV